MKQLSSCSREELLALQTEYKQAYADFQARGLTLDMSRGKPAPEQLDLTMPMLDVLTSRDCLTDATGLDCRNYGVLDGISEVKTLLAPMLGVSEEELVICGNSSLNIMYDTMTNAFTHGVLGGTPWSKLDQVKFLCPVPGYDRHFAICEHYGIEMINIPLTEGGPDMDMVERLVAEDDAIKGIWCVPQYSNPDGFSYSNDTIHRFASLKPKAKDFRIFWDNAYGIHHLTDEEVRVLNLLDEAKKAGNEDIVYMFASTSKISFPGAGVAMMAASKANLDSLKKTMAVRTIGYDKINMLRHVRFFKDFDGLKKHMELHKAIIAPKFDAVLDLLTQELTPLGIGSWTAPKGGYFISFNTPDGCAKRVVTLCKEAGVVLTGAGATFPNGIDPDDRNIRIAPTYPSVDELKTAVSLFCLCVKLAAVEKLLEN